MFAGPTLRHVRCERSAAVSARAAEPSPSSAAVAAEAPRSLCGDESGVVAAVVFAAPAPPDLELVQPPLRAGRRAGFVATAHARVPPAPSRSVSAARQGGVAGFTSRRAGSHPDEFSASAGSSRSTALQASAGLASRQVATRTGDATSANRYESLDTASPPRSPPRAPRIRRARKRRRAGLDDGPDSTRPGPAGTHARTTRGQMLAALGSRATGRPQKLSIPWAPGSGRSGDSPAGGSDGEARASQANVGAQGGALPGAPIRVPSR